MTSKKKIPILGALASLGCAGVAILVLSGTRSADAQSPPFRSLPAVENLSALRQPSVSAVPLPVQRLGVSQVSVHQLADNGYVWEEDRGSVCVVMQSGSGGCFSTFTKPVVLFMSGSTSDAGVQLSARAEGVVPDSVDAVTIVMEDGRRVAVEISSNSFNADLPVGVAIAGAEVTLRSGEIFLDANVLSPFSPRR